MPPILSFSRRTDAELANSRRLDELKGELYSFPAYDMGDLEKIQKCIAPQNLELKVGAQVMLLKNIEPPGLVNGSVGTVIEIDGFPKVKFPHKEMIVTPEEWRIEIPSEFIDIKNLSILCIVLVIDAAFFVNLRPR